MVRRVRPDVVRRRLLALLDPARLVMDCTSRSPDWHAGYVEGFRAARDVIRKEF